MKASTRWRRVLLRLVWTVPLAFAVVSAFAFTAVLDCFTTSGPCIDCVPGPPPPPTPEIPGSGGSPSDYTAIENLPSMAVVPNGTYYAGFTVCEGGINDPGGCFPFTFSWYDAPSANFSTADPCCMGIILQNQWFEVVVTDASGLPQAYQPVPRSWDEIQALYQDQLNADPLPAGDSRCAWTGGTLPYASFVGCAPISPYLHIDGAHELDHVTIDMDPDRGYASGGDYVKAIDHKFY